MKVTPKGQVTIPKNLRDQFGLAPGVQVDFAVASDGIRLSKVSKAVRHPSRQSVFGCLKTELAGRSVPEWLDELRGLVELPHRRRKNT